MFRHEYFIEWMEKLFDALSKRNVKNAMIIMDNAKYHNKLDDSVPKKNNKKQKMIDYLEKNKIDFDDGSSKQMIWEKVKEYVSKNVKPVVCNIASEKGHEIVYTPSYHSELQPMELIWAIVKGEVGRSHDYDTDFKITKKRLNEAFLNLKNKQIMGCIKKSRKYEEKIWEEVKKAEEIAEKKMDLDDVTDTDDFLDDSNDSDDENDIDYSDDENNLKDSEDVDVENE